MPGLFDEVPWWTTADMNNALSRERDKKLPVRPSYFNALVPQVKAQDAAVNRPDPVERASLFPLATYPDGSTKLALPGMIAEDIPRAITAPARAYRGEIPNDDMISEGLNFAGNMAMTGSIAPKPSNAAGMFGGRLGAENLAKKGETRPLRMLDMLDEMQKAGATREEIWDATRKIGEGSPYIGAHSGVDKIGRFEIDDSKAGALPSPGVTLAGKSEHSVPIGERIIHPEYMSAYPDAAGLNVQPIAGRMNSGAAGKYYNGKGFAYDASAPDRGRSIALHELQHDAQSREGFSLGGTPDMFWTDKRSLFGQGEAVDKYRRLAGETEARTVQKRADLTPEQRSSRPPWLDYDVPESQQIVRLGANTTEASAPGVVVAEAARQPRPVQMEVPFYRGSGHGQTSVDYSQPYWGTSDKGLASDYAKSRSRTYFDAEATPNVTPAVARFRNPLHIDAQNAGWSEIPFEGQKWNTDKLAETAKQRGHDGLVIDRIYDEGRWNPDEGLPSTVAALGPGTVSSAFDPNNILYGNGKSSGVPGVIASDAANGPKTFKGYHGAHDDDLFKWSLQEKAAYGLEYGQGPWGSSNPRVANSYAAFGDKASVAPVEYRFWNPLEIDAQGRRFNLSSMNSDVIAARAREAGHDGLVIRNMRDAAGSDLTKADTYAPLQPGTTYSALTGDLLYQNAKSAAPAGVVIAGAGDQAPRVANSDDALIQILQRYGLTQ